MVCRRFKKPCVVDGNAINRRTKKDIEASQEGSRKQRSWESSGEPESQAQKRQRLRHETIIIESDDESDGPRAEQFARKAAKEWTVRLLGQKVKKILEEKERLEWQVSTLQSLVIRLLEQELVWRPERVRSAGEGAEKGKEKEQEQAVAHKAEVEAFARLEDPIETHENPR